MVSVLSLQLVSSILAICIPCIIVRDANSVLIFNTTFATVALVQVILDWDFAFQGHVLCTAVLLLSLHIDPTQSSLMHLCVVYEKLWLLSIDYHCLLTCTCTHYVTGKVVLFCWVSLPASLLFSFWIHLLSLLQSRPGTFPDTLMMTRSLVTWVHSFSIPVHARKVLFCLT